MDLAANAAIEVNNARALIFRVCIGVRIFDTDEQCRNSAQFSDSGPTKPIEPPQPIKGRGAAIARLQRTQRAENAGCSGDVNHGPLAPAE